MQNLPIVLLLVFQVALGSQYTDYVQCVEQRQCGLFSVCGFTLDPPPADPTVPSARQYSTLKGYVMRVTNGLSTDIQVTWDILASSNTSASCSLKNVTRTFILNEHNSRYFNTHCTGLHTIRLQINNETADTEIANPDFTCSLDQACEYLVRACFANNDDPSCLDYTYYCQTVLKYSTMAIDTFRQSCIPECLADFYSNTIANPYQYKSDEIVNSMLSKYYTLVDAKSPVVGEKLNSVHITLIILGVAVVIIAIGIGVFFYVRNHTRFFRNRGGRV